MKNTTMNIRLEQPKDYREVENLTREAFWNVYRPGCTEHYVLFKYTKVIIQLCLVEKILCKYAATY